MTNAPLRVGCPTCSGSGRVSFVRSGMWLTQACPGRNGPIDVDNAPQTHELDNYRGKRKVRIEYKYPGESLSSGQSTHFLAELDSTRRDWKYLIVLMVDDGQTDIDDSVRYRMRWNTDVALGWSDEAMTTLREIGELIAKKIWPVAA